MERAAAIVALTAALVAVPLRGQPFLTHGTAAGDPTATEISLWARASGAALVSVLYAPNPTLSGAAESPAVAATAANDFSVRLDLAGLLPGTAYSYRIRVADPLLPTSSTLGPIGRFRTLPAAASASDLRFAVTADIAVPGTTAIFDSIAAADPAFVLLLGDWPYADAAPAATTLAAYRLKHQESRLHPGLLGLLRNHAIVPIYDDHEISNDWDAATSPGLVQLGRAVWKEFMPVRPSGDLLYRRLDLGASADLFVLDTRAYRGVNAAPDLPGRTLLGATQFAWLVAELQASQAPFKIIATSVPLRYGTTNKDHWQGYMRERQALFDAIEAARVPGVVFFSGDQHWSAVHHHREGFVELQACPATASVRPPPIDPDPEIRATWAVPSFGVVHLRGTANPPELVFEFHDASGALVGQEVVRAELPGRADAAPGDPDAGVVFAGPQHFRARGARSAFPRVPPGAYTVSWTLPENAATAPDPLPAIVAPGGFVAAAATFDTLPDPAHPELFRADFTTRDLSAWTIVDEVPGQVSAWFQDDFRLIQSSNLFGGSTAAADPEKPGTYAAAGSTAWTDLTLRFRVMTNDDDGIGALLRLAPDGSSYRFVMDSQRNYRRLVRRSGGVSTTLAEVAAGYEPGRWYTIDFRAIGAALSVAIDGVPVLSATDSTLPAGRVGLFCWGSEVVFFEQVRVHAGSPPPSPPGALLHDDFGSGSLAGWTAIDQGTISAPSAWSVQGGAAIQSSNIYGGTLAGSDPVKPGTFLLRGDPGWTDVTALATLSCDDNDGIGLMLRVVDAQNYYRFSMDAERDYRRLVRVQNGVTTTLAETTGGYVPGRRYRVGFSARGSALRVDLDGVPILAATDAAHSAGRIALYCWGAVLARFDDVLVRPAGLPVAAVAAGDRGGFTITLGASSLPFRPYLLALSLGTAPGIPLSLLAAGDPRVVPLAPDSLFFASLSPSPLWSGFQGTLDANGRAGAAVTLPPGTLPSGFQCFAAGLILDPAHPAGVAAVIPAIPITVP